MTDDKFARWGLNVVAVLTVAPVYAFIAFCILIALTSCNTHRETAAAAANIGEAARAARAGIVDLGAILPAVEVQADAIHRRLGGDIPATVPQQAWTNPEQATVASKAQADAVDKEAAFWNSVRGVIGIAWTWASTTWPILGAAALWLNRRRKTLLTAASKAVEFGVSVAKTAKDNGVDVEQIKDKALKSQVLAGVWNILAPMIEQAKQPPKQEG